jgi:3-deoxy-D-manno-octulosonate 8-phosphate phosphatase (KDO 8-P phosphatase)
MKNNDFDWFKNCLEDKDFVKSLKDIKLVITDVDGSITDGKITCTEDMEFSREFSIQDGFGIGQSIKSGLPVAFLSGKNHGSAQKMAKTIGIPNDLCITGKQEKLVVIQEITKKRDLKLNQILLFGDDFLDARVKLEASNILFSMPQDAPFYLQSYADVVVPRNGGDHAFRLLLDLILYVQSKHFAQSTINNSLKHSQF